jgi:aryl-phospho-beta-D-glucosidase BglC (GH1 family)
MPTELTVLAKKGLFNSEFFTEIAATGANVVRIPIHPEYWERDPDYLWRNLEPAVQWAGENGLHAIIDLHFIGNIATNRGAQMPDIEAHSKDFALEFWQQTAAYFKDAPHVIFEIFNEPTGISAAEWRANAETLVAAIRETGAQQIIIVGGIEYSRDLSWVLDEPIFGENIAYAIHIYPAHHHSSWDRWFGEVAAQHPVVMTEWGWVEDNQNGKQPYLVGTQERYGEALIKYLDEHSIGWVACWYDDEWQPDMFHDNFTQINPYGQFVAHMLKE